MGERPKPLGAELRAQVIASYEPEPTETLDQACRRLPAALGLIAKNVRDIPRLPRAVRPSRREVPKIVSKLNAISEAAWKQRKWINDLVGNPICEDERDEQN